MTSPEDLDGEEQVKAIVRILAGALRQGFSEEELAAATEFVRHYAPLDDEQLLQLEERVRMLSENEPELAPMPTLVNPFVELGKLKGRQEGRAEGLEKGLEKGLQKGRREGRMEGQRADILEALEIRFGRVPKGLREAVGAVNRPARLSELHRAALTSATLEEFAESI